MKSVHARITGRVQGVGFRAWMEQTAERLGVRGWVRNRRDGSVEAVIAGDTSKVDEMLTMCWQGPPAAKVDGVSVDDAQAPAGNGFESRPTE
jgi:acylphosphatase